MFKRLLALAFLGLLAQNTLSRELRDFTQLVEKQRPAVVNISTTQTIRDDPAFPGVDNSDPFFQFFRRFGPQYGERDQTRRSLGSGFIISHNGYILTNAHVVEGADAVTVRLADRRAFKARVIGADKQVDVALLKIKAADLPTIKPGDPGKLKVGEWVVAIGSPFGFDNSVTAGIVSAKGRFLPRETYVPFIQTDAAINPGNSGGPLFNMEGEVVGINSRILTRSGGYMGLSFAIPITAAMDIATQLRTTGKVTRGRIGVGIQSLTGELAKSFGLRGSRGALIRYVEKDGPADHAGIRRDDVILKVDGTPVKEAIDLPRIVAGIRPGTTVAVELWRKGKVRDVRVTVGELSDDVEAGPRSLPRAPKVGVVVARAGLTLSELSRVQRAALQLDGGLVIEEAHGPALRVGLRPGDMILSINNASALTLDKFTKVLDKVPKGRHVALLVRRGERARYVALRLDGK